MAFIILRYVPSRPSLMKSFYHEWMLNFVKCFFCIYWDDHMIFILPFVNVVHHIDWFANIEPSLHPWNKSHLIIVYDPFLYIVEFGVLILCWVFLHLYSSEILAFNFPLFIVSVWFWCQHNVALIEWIWECSTLFNFLE